LHDSFFLNDLGKQDNKLRNARGLGSAVRSGAKQFDAFAALKTYLVTNKNVQRESLNQLAPSPPSTA